jgi:hypothetical protein
MSWPEIKHKLAANISRVAVDLAECSLGKVGECNLGGIYPVLIRAVICRRTSCSAERPSSIHIEIIRAGQ